MTRALECSHVLSKLASTHGSRLAGPKLHQSFLNFAKEFISVLFMMFICSLDENIRIGGLVGTQMCTNQLKHKHEAFISFYFIFFQT